MSEPQYETITLDEILGLNDVERVVARLTRHAMGEEDMTPTEVAAAKIVLGKKMPDVKAIEMTGKNGGPIEHAITSITLEAVDAPKR